LDLGGRSVLDIGCGTGGVDFVLARDLNAGRVIAIDVEPDLLARARERLEASHPELVDRIEFRLVEPGPLDWPDGTFDVVFSKDAMIHIPDKADLFREVYRVLRPGGVFAASDWLGGDNLDAPEWLWYQELGHLDFAMATAAQTEAMLRDAGFAEVTSVDRNGWYAAVTRQEVRDLEGPLRDRLLEVVDADLYRHWLEVRRALRDAVIVGALRPTHIRGVRPA
jgi:phosphoethanolamine N-methyltransferase